MYFTFVFDFGCRVLASKGLLLRALMDSCVVFAGAFVGSSWPSTARRPIHEWNFRIGLGDIRMKTAQGIYEHSHCDCRDYQSFRTLCSSLRAVYIWALVVRLMTLPSDLASSKPQPFGSRDLAGPPETSSKTTPEISQLWHRIAR